MSFLSSTTFALRNLGSFNLRVASYNMFPHMEQRPMVDIVEVIVRTSSFNYLFSAAKLRRKKQTTKENKKNVFLLLFPDH